MCYGDGKWMCGRERFVLRTNVPYLAMKLPDMGHPRFVEKASGWI